MENIIAERDVVADTLAEEVRRAAQLQLLVDGVDSVFKDKVQFRCMFTHQYNVMMLVGRV
jgi:hypothetical protein